MPKLWRSVGIYGGASIIKGALPFMILPIMARALSPHSLGIEANFRIVAGFLSLIVGLSTVGAIQRQYYDREDVNFPVYVGSCAWIALASSAFVFLVGLFVARPIENLTGIPPEWQWTLLVHAMATWFTAVALGLWQVRERPRAFAAFQISQTGVDLGLSLVLVLVYKLDWQGRVLGQVIAACAFAVIGLFLMRRDRMISKRYDRAYAKDATKLGLSYVANGLGAIFLGAGDRLALSHISGLAAAGTYAVAYQLAMPLQYAIDAVIKTWLPEVFRRLKEKGEDSKPGLVKNTYKFDLIFFGGAAILAPFMMLIAHPFASEKHQFAANHIPWLLFAFAMTGMARLRAIYLMYAREVWRQATGIFLAGATNVGACFVLIPKFGPIGAAQASLLSAVVYLISAWIFSGFTYRMPWFSFSRQKPAPGG